jgi:hypothetical protein
MIKTWNRITDEIIAKNANEVWGTQDWTISTTKQADELSVTRGEVGTAATHTKSGKKKFMERWKSMILVYHIMTLLTPEGQASIKLRENTYQWIDPLSDEIILDGCLLLNETFKLMRPDVQTNVYAKLAKIKAIKPVNHGYSVVKWHSAMESKRIAIEEKVPGWYHKSQFIMDYLDASLTIKTKSFKAEVNIIYNRYLHGNPDKWDATYICSEIKKKHTTTCLKTELGREKSRKRIRSLRSPLRLQNSKPNLRIRIHMLLLL